MIYANTMSQAAAQQTFGERARIIMQRTLYYDIMVVRKDVRLYEDRAY